MEIKAIKYVLRRNLGNYEHEELTLEGVVSGKETAEDAIDAIMKLAEDSLNGHVSELNHKREQPIAAKPELVQKVTDKISGATAEINHGGVVGKDTLPSGQEIPAVITEKPKSAPRRAATKPKEEVATPEAAPSENAGGASQVAGSVDRANVASAQSAAPKASTPVKGLVAYDSTVKEHRSRFATYLGTTFPSWKTAAPEDKIREFSKNLHGKAFEDAKGNMLPEFKAELAGFFGKK